MTDQGERQHVTDFRPNPVQRAFIESRSEADLFCSRRGEGKSTALCWSILYHTRHNPGANWAVVRDTFENLQKSTMKTFFEWFPDGVWGHYHHTKKLWTWAEGVAEGTVSFVGMDNPQDASTFLSWELAGIAIDEPAPAAGSAGIDEMIFDLGMTCLRQPNMQWYSVKLATNNPDETHWTYRKFVDEGAETGYRFFQPTEPENINNLPDGYYERMRKSLAHRPDLVRRFVDGEFGFQQEGIQVTPQWDENRHLATGLSPLRNQDIICLWDFGLTPVCIVTQVTPSGFWLILDSCVMPDGGVTELIEQQVRPLLAGPRYNLTLGGDEFSARLRHIGDPAGTTREQTSSERSAVRYIRKALGGSWRSGPVRFYERRDGIQRALYQGDLVKVDRHRAKEVWHALRGGWHYSQARSGIVSKEPIKNHPHSDVGDAMGYGAAVLFPPGKIVAPNQEVGPMPHTPKYFSRWQSLSGNVSMPAHGSVLGAPKAGSKGYFGG